MSIIAPSQIFHPTNASEFDGTANIMKKSYSYSGDGPIIISFWCKVGSDANAARPIIELTSTFNGTVVQVVQPSGATRKLTFQCFAQPGASSVYVLTPATIFNIAAGWQHVLISADLNHAPSSRLAKIYVNDVDVTPSPTTNTGSAFNPIATGSYVAEIGGDEVFGADYFSGDLAELFLDIGYMDLSVTANRRKFISATKRPVFLGSTGGLPNNGTPIIYLKGSGTGFNINSGSLGNFTTTGTLTTPATTPSAP